MKKLFAALAMIAAPFGATPVLAQTAPVTADDTVRRALALELATLLNSEALTRVQIRKMFDETIPNSLRADPQMAAMERQYPGIVKAMIEAMEPIITEGTVRTLPGLWAELAPIYADGMSAEHLRAVLIFYRSPLGVKLIELMGVESDYSVAMNDALRNRGEVSLGGLQAGVNAGVAGLQRRLSDAEIAQVAAFEASPAGGSLGKLIPRIQSAAAAWSNKRDPELDARVEAAMTGVVDKFTGRKSAQ